MPDSYDLLCVYLQYVTGSHKSHGKYSFKNNQTNNNKRCASFLNDPEEKKKICTLHVRKCAMLRGVKSLFKYMCLLFVCLIKMLLDYYVCFSLWTSSVQVLAQTVTSCPRVPFNCYLCLSGLPSSLLPLHSLIFTALFTVTSISIWRMWHILCDFPSWHSQSRF